MTGSQVAPPVDTAIVGVAWLGISSECELRVRVTVQGAGVSPRLHIKLAAGNQVWSLINITSAQVLLLLSSFIISAPLDVCYRGI